MASLQERSRKMREKREANRLKADTIKDSLKLEEKKAERITQKYRNENPRRKVARDSQIRKLQKKEDERKALKPTPKPAPKPAPKPKANRATDKGGREAAPGSSGYKPTKTDMGPNMNKVNKPDAKSAPKKEEFDRMQAARDQMKRARASMGFKKGGKVRGDGICKQGKTKGRFV